MRIPQRLSGIFWVLGLVLGVPQATFADQVKYRNGDIIFQETRSNQAEAIKRATGSPYSHVGIVYFQKQKAFVFEAVQPVKLTPLPEFIRHGVEKKYVVKRLKNAGAITPESAQSMYRAGKKHLGKNYDWVFGWSDEKIYCSELVWKIYKEGLGIELSRPKKLKEFNLTDKVVQKKLRERYGDKIPYEEPVVSPGQLFDSPLLETVYGD